MTKQFPKFASHEAAKCFNCRDALNGYSRKSGFAPKRGEYAQDCRKCQMFTCYDIKPAKRAA